MSRGTLRVRVLDALNLISGDSLTGASDPYTAIRIGNSKSPAKTRVINRSLAPRWNESFEIGFPLDGADPVTFEVFDHNLILADELLGAVTISGLAIRSLVQGKEFGLSLPLAMPPKILDGEAFQAAVQQRLPPEGRGVLRVIVCALNFGQQPGSAMARSIEGFALDLTSTPRKGSAPPPVLTPASADVDAVKKKAAEEEDEAKRKKAAEEEEETKRKEEKAARKREAEEAWAAALKNEEARKKAQEEQAARKKAEDAAAAARKKVEEEEQLARKKAEEAVARQKADEEAAAKKKAQEEEAKKKAEEEAAGKKKAEEEAAAKKKADEEAEVARTKAAEEAAAKKKAEEESARKKAEEEASAKRRAEEEAAAAMKKAQEEAAARKKAQEEEAARKKAAEEAAAKKKAEEEADGKKKADEEAARKEKAEEEAAAKKKADEEAAAAKKKTEEEAVAVKAAAELAARKYAEAEAAKKKAADEEAAAAAAKKKAADEEAAKRRRSALDAAKGIADEAARKRTEQQSRVVDLSTLSADGNNSAPTTSAPLAGSPYNAMFAMGVEKWYPKLRNETFVTRFVPLSRDEASAIVAMRNTFEIRGGKFRQISVLAEPHDTILKGVLRKVSAEMANGEFTPCFIKLNSRSPKDSVYECENKTVLTHFNAGIAKLYESAEAKMHLRNFAREQEQEQEKASSAESFSRKKSSASARWLSNAELIEFFTAANRSMCCRSAEEALQLLYLSDRVCNDLTDALRSSSAELFAPQLVLRKWVPIELRNEYRAFVSNGKMTALSQYYHFLHFPDLEAKKSEIQKRILDYYEQTIKPLLFPELRSFCIDFAFLGESLDRICVIELNPMNEFTGACNFSWKKGAAERKVLLEGPFEFRLSTESMEDAATRFLVSYWEHVLVSTREEKIAALQGGGGAGEGRGKSFLVGIAVAAVAAVVLSVVILKRNPKDVIMIPSKK